MKNTIAALRADYLAVGIALAALLLVALLNFKNSAGVIRGGDDDGSGIGGTGLKPFLGINQTTNGSEVLALSISRPSSVSAITSQADSSSLAVTVTPPKPVSAPQVTSVRFRTVDSSPINITEAIQVSLDELAAIVINDPATEINVEQISHDNDMTKSDPAVLHLQLTDTKLLNTADRSLAAVAHTADPWEANSATTEPFTASESVIVNISGGTPSAIVEPSPDNNPDAASWNKLANYLVNKSNRSEVNGPSERQLSATESRSTPTRKIQRPELPPVQRVRPVERLSVLPPRIQPLRL